MDERFSAICERVREAFPEHVSEAVVELDEVSMRVRRGAVKDVTLYLRDVVPFEMLADVSAVDYLGVAPPEERFMLSYHLYSFSLNLRIRLRVFVPEQDTQIDSVASVWPTANWQEREIFDFFGITFNGHPDLRRILMPDDWEGHPHRKDYPLGGTKVEYKGKTVPPPDTRKQPTTTTGYPGRIS